MRADRPRTEPPGHVRVGQVVGAFGVKGMLKVLPLTDFAERFAPGSLLYLHGEPRKVLEVHWHKGQARVHLEGINTVEEANAQQWAHLTVPELDRPRLGADEFFAADLIGMSVVEKGMLLGVVQDVLHAPAQDLIQIEGALIPCVKQFVKSVDMVARKIDVELIEGMRPGDGSEEP